MGSGATLTVLAVVGLALFALVVVLLAVFALSEVRRWVRAFSGVRRVSLGPRFEVTVNSDLQVIDEAHELRPLVRRLLVEGRRDEAMRLYRAFTGNDSVDADAGLEAFARDESPRQQTPP